MVFNGFTICFNVLLLLVTESMFSTRKKIFQIYWQILAGHFFARTPNNKFSLIYKIERRNRYESV